MPGDPALSPKHIPGVGQGVSRRGGAMPSCQGTGLIPRTLIRSLRDRAPPSHARSETGGSLGPIYSAVIGSGDISV